MTAFSGFYSVISQMAFAMNGYFHLGMEAHEINLASVWWDPARRGRKRRGKSLPTAPNEIRRALRRAPNPGLTALYGLAASLEWGQGRYFALRRLRNGIEHHLVVVASGAKPNRYYVTITRDRLAADAIRMGRVAKAAIWYFAAAVLYAERGRARVAVRKGVRVSHGSGALVERA